MMAPATPPIKNQSHREVLATFRQLRHLRDRVADCAEAVQKTPDCLPALADELRAIRQAVQQSLQDLDLGGLK